MVLTWRPAKIKFGSRKRICTEVQFESFLYDLSKICQFSWQEVAENFRKEYFSGLLRSKKVDRRA